jgi:hypothetical protein
MQALSAGAIGRQPKLTAVLVVAQKGPLARGPSLQAGTPHRAGSLLA